MSRFFRSPAFTWLAVSLVTIVCFTVAPLASLIIAGGIANAMGCMIPVSSTAPCLVMGVDLSDTLTLMIFAGYLGFLTIPVGEIVLTIWFAVACITTIGWWGRHRKGEV
jgi:hypothetical protein